MLSPLVDGATVISETYARECETALRLTSQIDSLHSAPHVAQRLLELTRDPNFSMQEVAQCIEADPALAAKILKTINSSRYSLRRSVTSLRQAASYLGQRSLRLLALTFGLTEALTRGAPGQLCRDYWRRALTIATVASHLARRAEEPPADEAYTAGLLADTGVLVLAQVDAEAAADLAARLPHGAELVEGERAQFGVGHPVVSAVLLECWGLPKGFVLAIADHHDEDVETPMAAAIRAGDLMANALWVPGSQAIQQAKQLSRDTFGIGTDAFVDLALDCQREITEAAGVFGVELGQSIDCKRLVEEARKQFAEASVEMALEIDELVGPPRRRV